MALHNISELGAMAPVALGFETNAKKNFMKFFIFFIATVFLLSANVECLRAWFILSKPFNQFSALECTTFLQKSPSLHQERVKKAKTIAKYSQSMGARLFVKKGACYKYPLKNPKDAG
tara:strand:- start:1614 stop:1967 length:354 start_codon:yes stop_codon:yes gene_type:complete